MVDQNSGAEVDFFITLLDLDGYDEVEGGGPAPSFAIEDRGWRLTNEKKVFCFIFVCSRYYFILSTLSKKVFNIVTYEGNL